MRILFDLPAGHIAALTDVRMLQLAFRLLLTGQQVCNS